MPNYIWRNPQTGESIEVLRSMQDIDVPPSEEELDSQGYSSSPSDMVRVMAPRGIKQRTAKWGFGKGYFNSQTPGRGKQ